MSESTKEKDESTSRAESEPPPYPTHVPPPQYSADTLPPCYQDLPQKKVDLPPYPELEPGPREDTDRYLIGIGRLYSLSEEELGSDSVFLLCFLVCFLFNWVGYLFCFCFFNSVAARCGALSGIGLNLVKMLLILRRCTFENAHMVQAQHYIRVHEAQYLLLMCLGLIIVFFGILRYNQAKMAVRRSFLPM